MCVYHLDIIVSFLSFIVHIIVQLILLLHLLSMSGRKQLRKAVNIAGTADDRIAVDDDAMSDTDATDANANRRGPHKRSSNDNEKTNSGRQKKAKRDDIERKKRDNDNDDAMEDETESDDANEDGVDNDDGEEGDIANDDASYIVNDESSVDPPKVSDTYQIKHIDIIVPQRYFDIARTSSSFI